MRITQEADYALRICAALAKEARPVGTPQLSQTLMIPPRSTSKILRILMLEGLVESVRGVNGGFSLATDAKSLTLRRVIEAVDGPIAIRHCLMGEHRCNFQTDPEQCRFHCVFQSLNALITDRLEQLTIGDMVESDPST